MDKPCFSMDQLEQFWKWSKDRAESEAHDRYPDSDETKRRKWVDTRTMIYYCQYTGINL